MAWPPEQHFEELILQAQQELQDVHIIRRDVGQSRALIDFEATWQEYRIVVSEIHRADGTARYAYYVLDSGNQLVQGFDNSRDIQAVRLCYGSNWKVYREEEIPHRHDGAGNLSLTSFTTFVDFVDWFKRYITREG